MGHFHVPEAESIPGAIARLSRAGPVVSEEVIAELHVPAVGGCRTTLGGRDFAAGPLKAALSAKPAAKVKDRPDSTMAGS